MSTEDQLKGYKDGITYNQSCNQAEEIIRQLEQGKLPLIEASTAYRYIAIAEGIDYKYGGSNKKFIKLLRDRLKETIPRSKSLADKVEA